MARAAEKPAEDPGFDVRLARLEEIVRELEEGGLGLEQAIGRYRDGVALLRECREVLAGFQKQVEELSRDPEGSSRPYAGDPDLAGGSALPSSGPSADRSALPSTGPSTAKRAPE